MMHRKTHIALFCLLLCCASSAVVAQGGRSPRRPPVDRSQRGFADRQRGLIGTPTPYSPSGQARPTFIPPRTGKPVVPTPLPPPPTPKPKPGSGFNPRANPVATPGMRPTPPHGGTTGSPPRGKKRGGNTKGYTQSDWRNWWDLNSAHYLDLENRFEARRRRQERDRDIFLGESTGADEIEKHADRADVRTFALPRLRHLLSHESFVVRAEAVLALGRSGVDSDFACITPLVKDENRQVRRNAIYALGLLGIEKALPLLTFVLRDSSVQIDEQIAATLALGLIGSDPAADALQESMKRTPAVRDLQAATLHALGFVDSVKARVFLKHYFYRSSIDPNLRAIALGSLGKQGVDGAVEILSESLSHKEVMVRRSAALALGSIDFKGTWASDLAEHRRELRGAVSASTGRRLVEEQIANFLVAAEVSAYRTRDRLFADRRMASDALVRVGLKDSDETVRNFSAIALGQVGDSMSLSVLRKAFVDSSSRSFQAHAALALGIADATLGGPDLLTALEHRTLDQVTRAAVILAAGLKEHEAATRRIAREFKTRADASTSGAAAVALGLLGYRDEIPRLRRSVLSTSRPELKPDYGVALSLLGDAKSVRGLGKLVRSRRSSSARIQSVRALSAMRDATSLKLLVEATLSNGVGDMVLAVSVRALGTLAERGTLPVTSEFYRHLNHTLSVGHLSFFASL